MAENNPGDEPKKQEVIHSKIWQETPEEDNPFAAKVAYCSGFDVYGDLLGKISWIEYLYLLFKLEPPTEAQAKLLEGIAVAIANPGPRDLSVRAAMNGGVGGSTAASCLMAALAPGAGQYGGAREVYLIMRLWRQCGQDLAQWQAQLSDYQKEELHEVWPDIDHVPGFDPYGASCPLPIKQTLTHLVDVTPGDHLSWLSSHREQLEAAAGSPITMNSVIAAAFMDLEFSDEQSEMAALLLKLPGAAVHSLEQKENGWRRYPFFHTGITVPNDPGPESNFVEGSGEQS